MLVMRGRASTIFWKLAMKLAGEPEALLPVLPQFQALLIERRRRKGRNANIGARQRQRNQK
jgi:hypothetical protein